MRHQCARAQRVAYAQPRGRSGSRGTRGEARQHPALHARLRCGLPTPDSAGARPPGPPGREHVRLGPHRPEWGAPRGAGAGDGPPLRSRSGEERGLESGVSGAQARPGRAGPRRRVWPGPAWLSAPALTALTGRPGGSAGPTAHSTSDLGRWGEGRRATGLRFRDGASWRAWRGAVGKGRVAGASPRGAPGMTATDHPKPSGPRPPRPPGALWKGACRPAGGVVPERHRLPPSATAGAAGPTSRANPAPRHRPARLADRPGPPRIGSCPAVVSSGLSRS